VEHNPKTCKICQETGDWNTTPDTVEFFQKHKDAGIELSIRNGKLEEVHRYQIPAECDHDWADWMNAMHTVPAGGEEAVQLRYCRKCRTSETREV